MACFSPLTAWRSRERTSSGKRGVVFKMNQGYANERLEVPCGQCIGCRVTKARQWAVRCVHEASQHKENCFVTLTYNDENMPGEVKVRDVQLFMKRLRQRTGVKMRYFCVGEYGERFSRPHYHLLLFGFDFRDKKYWCGSGLSRQYRSELLESLWTVGYSTVGTVTPASASYVAQYCTKIITGKKAKEHYGERAPEFAVMSRRPGIGSPWIEKYASVLFDRDFVVVDGGKKVAIPKYYMGKLPEDVKCRMVEERKRRNEYSEESRGLRAFARQECLSDKLNKGRRGYENEADCV